MKVEIILKSHSDSLNLKGKIMTKITTVEKEALCIIQQYFTELCKNF